MLGVGCSFTKHVRYINIPAGKTIIQITNDPRDLNKDYQVDILLLPSWPTPSWPCAS